MELKPCPFCGGSAHDFEDKVYCKGHGEGGCGANMPAGLWNTRTHPHTHADLIKVAEAMREMCVAQTGNAVIRGNIRQCDPLEAIRKAGL